MGIDIKQMYLDLNELLEDICNFLSGDKLQKLSPKDQNLAESLINRSRIQLQEISKISTNQNNEEYMIMDRNISVIENDEEGKANIYSSVDDDSTRRVEAEIIEDDTITFPYADLPAKEASKDVKYGFVFMKRKVMFLGFEKMKRVYGSIHEGWLLIYVSDKDQKPICSLNLRHYEAKESDGDKTDFQLMSSRAGGKSYHFVALTRKDLRQWVTQINRRHGRALNKDETKECEGFTDDESENIYERLVTMVPVRSSHPSIVPTPMPIPPIPTPSRSKLSTTAKSKPKKPIEVPPPVIKNFPKRHSSDSSDDEPPPATTATHKTSRDSEKSLDAEAGDSFSSDNDEEPIYEEYTAMQGQDRCWRNNSTAICEAPTKPNLQTVSSSRMTTRPAKDPALPSSRSKSHRALAAAEDETDDSQSPRESEDCIYNQFSAVGTVRKEGCFDSIGSREPRRKYDKPSIGVKPPKLRTNQTRRGSIEPK